MFNLTNKVAVITGGGSGIGKSISILFAQQGARVHILDKDEMGATTTCKEIGSSQQGATAKAHFCDVTNQREVNELIRSIAEDEGGIHILVNNAGIAHIGTVEQTSEDDLDRLLQVNVKGLYNCLYAVIPYMKQSGGSIVNMASVASSVGIPERFAYSLTKGAVVGITLSIARDYLSSNIRCNCISPARVHTPFVDGFLAKSYPGREAEMFEKLSKTQPIGRMATPAEVAGFVLYLCSDEASFMTGCDYPFDGGFIHLNN